MPVFETSDLLRFYNEGEQEFSDEQPFLFDRFSPDVVSGAGDYIIPDWVRAISRVTYQGKKLDPLPMRSYRETFQPGSQQGRPFWYVFNNIGQNKIKLFPIPNQTIPAAITDLWGSDAIRDSVIVEYARISDNDQFILPEWARDFVLKQYIGKMCYQIEGPGQNLKMAQFFSSQWDLWSGELKSLLNTLYSQPRKMYLSGGSSNNGFPGSPCLPIDRFGISVETGY